MCLLHREKNEAPSPKWTIKENSIQDKGNKVYTFGKSKDKYSRSVAYRVRDVHYHASHFLLDVQGAKRWLPERPGLVDF